MSIKVNFLGGTCCNHNICLRWCSHDGTIGTMEISQMCTAVCQIKSNQIKSNWNSEVLNGKNGTIRRIRPRKTGAVLPTFLKHLAPQKSRSDFLRPKNTNKWGPYYLDIFLQYRGSLFRVYDPWIRSRFTLGTIDFLITCTERGGSISKCSPNKF